MWNLIYRFIIAFSFTFIGVWWGLVCVELRDGKMGVGVGQGRVVVEV